MIEVVELANLRVAEIDKLDDIVCQVDLLFWQIKKPRSGPETTF